MIDAVEKNLFLALGERSFNEMQVSKGLKGRESRERIMAAAAYEFASHGFHETKISSIVSRAGLTQPAFYLYFSSKEAIFNELVDDFRFRLFRLTEELRLTAGMRKEELAQRTLDAVTALFRFLAEDPNLTRIGLFQAHDAEQCKEAAISLVTENLLAEQQAGYYRSELNMSIVAASIVGMIERLTASCLLPGAYEPEVIAKEIMNLLMYGMTTALES